MPPQNPDDMRKLIESLARRAIGDVSLAQDPDAQLILRVVKILLEISHLVPELPRLETLVSDPNTRLYLTESPALSPEMKEHMKNMRKAQIGALLNVIRVIERTVSATFTEAPRLDAQARKRAVDEALSRIGFEKDKGHEQQQ